MESGNGIFSIEEMVKREGADFKNKFYRIFSVESLNSKMSVPVAFRSRLVNYFKTSDEDSEEDIIKKISSQKIVKIYNNFTGEGTLFNYLRAMRPGVKSGSLEKRKKVIEKLINDSKSDCDFCNPISLTPEDEFGRVKGEYCITAANIAKYDRYHSLIVFNNHNPLEFSLREFRDYIKTFLKWHSIVLKIAPEYINPILIWNCLPRSGASKIHGHMQVLASKTPYPKTGIILNAMKNTGNSYLSDIILIHEKLGVLHEINDVKIMAYLTPIKENEVFIVSEKIDDTFMEAVYKVLRVYIDELYIFNFNMSIQKVEYEKGIYYITRIVDRGNPESKVSDFASMELYAASVVSSDPFRLIKSISNL